MSRERVEKEDEMSAMVLCRRWSCRWSVFVIAGPSGFSGLCRIEILGR